MKLVKKRTGHEAVTSAVLNTPFKGFSLNRRGFLQRSGAAMGGGRGSVGHGTSDDQKSRCCGH
jgi:hypothetical protein